MPARAGDVGEGAVAVVAVQDVGLADEIPRTAQHVDAMILAVRCGAALRNGQLVERHVVGHVQIEVAVAVVIAERAARAPAWISDTGARA